MAKRLPEGPPEIDERDRQLAVSELPELPAAQALLDLFPRVLAVLQGLDSAGRANLLASMPYTVGRLRHLWQELVGQAPRAVFNIAVDAFTYANEEDYHRWLPADTTGDLVALAVEFSRPDVRPAGKMLMPDLHFRFPRPEPAPLPLCTMHGLTETEHLTLAMAVANALAGAVAHGPAPHAWLQTAIIVHMRHHELCLVGHEILSQALHENAHGAVARLLDAAPDSFFLDVLIYEPASRNLPFAAELAARRERLWDAARELAPVRPAVRAALRATRISLHSYQQAAVSWAAERERLPPVDGTRFGGGEFAILPGLGKTRIALALAALPTADGSPRGTTLVLCPLAVINDWLVENDISGARLTVRVLHGDYDARNKAYVPHFNEWVASGVDLIVSTVKTFNDGMSGATGAAMARLRRVVIDEVHLLSNPQTAMYKKLAEHLTPVAHRWGLTGTPFLNARKDLTHQLRLLGLPHAPAPADEKAIFKHLYQVEYGPETATRGPRSLELIEVPLAPLEWDLYKQVYDYGRELRESGAEFARIQAAMMRMRQAAVSLELVPLPLLEQMRDEAIADMEKKQFAITSLWKRAMRVTGISRTPFHLKEGALHNYISARFTAVIGKMDEIAATYPNDKMLVFSSLAQTFHKLTVHLQNGPARAWTYGVYDGDASTKARREMRDRFDSDPAMKVLFITYGAGASGMNLQAATHVLEIDPCFNDATLNQAEARAWRIRKGPTRIVRVYRFMAPRTYEERMEEIRVRKANDWLAFRGAETGAEDPDAPPERLVDTFFA